MANKKYVQENTVAETAPTPLNGTSAPQKAAPSSPGLDDLSIALDKLATATAEVAAATVANADALGRLVEKTDAIERQIRGQTEAAAKALGKMSERSRAARELVAELRQVRAGE